MTVGAAHVFLYAADAGDLTLATAAAEVCGIPKSNVIGEFSRAWQLAASASDMIVAVGSAAVNALFYNECDWPNPSGMTGGSTPFSMFPIGHGADKPQANRFVNAAGSTGIASLKLAVMLSYYAVHGVYPHQLSGLPTQEAPQKVCLSSARSNVLHPTGSGPRRPAASGGVGVYADFVTASAVDNAVKMGWKGIASTAGLGTAQSPYTQVLSWQPDQVIGKGLANTTDVWWLSFWTVSWPAGGEPFHQGGYDAGHYAATTIMGYANSVIPDYVILDPEGYNPPGSTPAEWAQWLEGWAAGIASVTAELKAGFYCNQYQYTTYQLSAVNLPAFVAVSPIAGNVPAVTGGNVKGYIAYYASCPAAGDVAQVERWGAPYSTVQFRDSGIDCAP